MSRPKAYRIIRDFEELRQYARRRSGVPCRLQLDGLSAEESPRWEKRLSRLDAVCGCTAAIFAGTVGVWIWATQYGPAAGVSRGALWWVPRLFTAFVLPAAVAKVLALRIARWRLRAVQEELAGRLGGMSTGRTFSDGGGRLPTDAALG